MTAPAAVRDRYLELFRAFSADGGAGAPPWLRELREGALHRATE